MKTEFELDPQFHKDKGHCVNIIGTVAEDNKVYVSFSSPDGYIIAYIHDKDLLRFAKNLDKALGYQMIKIPNQ